MKKEGEEVTIIYNNKIVKGIVLEVLKGEKFSDDIYRDICCYKVKTSDGFMVNKIKLDSVGRPYYSDELINEVWVNHSDLLLTYKEKMSMYKNPEN